MLQPAELKITEAVEKYHALRFRQLPPGRSDAEKFRRYIQERINMIKKMEK